jgi:hypothetical protein
MTLDVGHGITYSNMIQNKENHKIQKALGCFLDYLMTLSKLHKSYTTKWKNNYE